MGVRQVTTMRHTARLLALIAGVLLLSAANCNGKSTSDERAAAATEQRMQEASAQVGLANVTQFTELRFANMIQELRDQALKTWTYTVDVNGRRHLLCESVGYGLPYGVQTTNPQKIGYSSSYGVATLPQPEPNGLFMPETAEATWVLCSNGEGGVAPVYSEPQLLVSPFPLGHVSAADNSGRSDRVQIQAEQVRADSLAPVQR